MFTNQPLLRVQGVSKQYPGVRALDAVSMECLPGEVHVLLGANGAGKSTLMKIIAGSERPDEGTLVWQESVYAPASPAEAQKNGICMIHQELSIVPSLTVAENICLGQEPSLWGVIDKKRMDEDALHALQMLGVHMDVQQSVRDLPVSKWQVVEIARALYRKAQLVIMDEPTSSLSQVEIDGLFDVISQLKKQKVCVVYITHRMQEIKRIADRITVFKDGASMGTYMCSELSVDDMVEKMSGKKVFFKKQQGVGVGGKPLLKVRGVRLKGMPKPVSFEVCAGEVFVLTGLMGAGRTRLLKGLFGAEVVLEGDVCVEGVCLKKHTPRQAIEAGMGFVSEDRTSEGLVLQASVRENATLVHLADFLTLGYVSKKREKEQSSLVTQQLLLKTPSLEAAVKQLSGGNQQKVVLAKWLLGSSCKVLMFDEPTRGIDIAAKMDIYTLIQTLASQGKAILVVSSDIAETVLLADRVGVMHQGSWMGVLEGAAVCEERIMQASFAVSVQQST